jgi:hypothetical protein
MNEILKRLEIIKSSIAIDDEDIIELQVMKLNKLSPNIEIKNIISKLENHVYSSALFDIENYLKRYSSVVEYIDKEVQTHNQPHNTRNAVANQNFSILYFHLPIHFV